MKNEVLQWLAIILLFAWQLVRGRTIWFINQAIHLMNNNIRDLNEAMKKVLKS